MSTQFEVESLWGLYEYNKDCLTPAYAWPRGKFGLKDKYLQGKVTKGLSGASQVELGKARFVSGVSRIFGEVVFGMGVERL